MQIRVRVNIIPVTHSQKTCKKLRTFLVPGYNIPLSIPLAYMQVRASSCTVCVACERNTLTCLFYGTFRMVLKLIFVVVTYLFLPVFL